MFGIMNILMSFLGVVIGIIFGALPGMTATMAIAVFLPLTYSLDLGQALCLLLGLYVGGISGGLVPAILINIPGTPSSITTGFDGHPMAARGEGERALKIGITVSLIGGLISLLALFFFTPPLAKLAIKFSAVEKFLVTLIGRFFDNQQLRMVPSFLTVELGSGFQLLPVLIGLFALSQILEEAEAGMKRNPKMEGGIKGGGRKFSFSDFKGQGVNTIRSAAIGTFMGILPGVGGSAASLLSYSQAKNFSKHPDEFGKGCVDGLVASEAANNALTGGALIPLLSLGIPGDSTTAVLVGAFLLQGIQVGPLFITQNPDLWRDILIGLVVCNIIMFIVMFYPIKYIAKIINIPKNRLYPVVILMCVVGSYAIRNGNMFDVWTLLLFGIVGFVFSKTGIPAAPFLIGFILGDDFEKYFIDVLKSSEGSFAAFFNRPIGNIIWVLILISLAYAYFDNKRTKKIEAQNKA